MRNWLIFWKLWLIIIVIIAIVICIALSGCAQAIYEDKDIKIKVNTLFKDIKLGEYRSDVAKFRAITPYGGIETEDGE